MNKLLTSVAVAVALLGSQALAADPFVPVVPVMIEDETYDWSGFYVGANAGIGGGVFEHPMEGEFDDTPGEGSLDITAFGFLAGGTIGANVQSDSLVFGLEADIQASTIAGVLSGNIDIDDGDFTGDVALGTQVDWFATIRPRLGFASDNLLVYVTGGLAYGEVTSFFDGDFDGFPFSDSLTEGGWGWTAGFGVEYGITDNVSLKTEYLYTDLGEHNLLDEDFGGGDFLTIDNHAAFHLVRAGVNVSF